MVKRGQEIFLDDGLGKRNICHRNAGANALLLGQDAGNANFYTGVETLPDQPQDLTGGNQRQYENYGKGVSG